jgi:hypothetical protein
LELELNRIGTVHEVVILEAATEEALRRTHRRYFENLSELVNSPAEHASPVGETVTPPTSHSYLVLCTSLDRPPVLRVQK